MDLELCLETNRKEAKDSCLGCECIGTCQAFRAQYERKKATIQDSRYEAAKEQASRVESRSWEFQSWKHMRITAKTNGS